MAKSKATKKPVRKKKKEVVFENPDQHLQNIDFGEAMSNGFSSYAYYVATGRSLPDFRDGLIPVQRRSLFGMYDNKWFSNKPYIKSARIVGDVMGKYHPHGDSAIYGAIARMSKGWIFGINQVDMSGNNGSIDGDMEAAMRYCLTGEALVSLEDGSLVSIDSLLENTPNNSTHDLDIDVLDYNVEKTKASKFFNSGLHIIYNLALDNGNQISGSSNHPLMVAQKDFRGKYTALWKTLSDINEKDIVIQPLSPIRNKQLTGSLESFENEYPNDFFTSLDSDFSQVFSEPENHILFLQKLIGLKGKFVSSKESLTLVPELVIENLSKNQATIIQQLLFNTGSSSRIDCQNNVAIKDKFSLENIEKGILQQEFPNEFKKDMLEKSIDDIVSIENMTGTYILSKVNHVKVLKEKDVVYSIRVDSEDHSFIANSMINHNTESRLSHYSEDILLSNLSLKGIVPEVLNYDDTLYEPEFLPSKVPNILVNGSEGIGVGFASRIPPFNLGEILDACIAEIENPEISDMELLEYIPAPDLPTGGVISGYKDFYSTLIDGNGVIRVRGSYTIIDNPETKGKDIVFTEIPYGSIKPQIIDTINEAVFNKEISGVIKARDDSDTDGIHLTIECSEVANIDGILAYLFTKTSLQKNVPLNMVVLHRNKPKVMGVPTIIREFNTFRKDIFSRGLSLQIVEYQYKRHYNEGYLHLVNNIEEVISIIKESSSKKESLLSLIDFGFSEKQAKRVLDMSLHRINKSEKSVFEKAIEECTVEINNREMILENPHLLDQAVIASYKQIQKEYPTPRKTALIAEAENWVFSPESIIPRENMVVGISRDGFIKTSTLRSYKQTNVENDVEFIIETDTTKSIIIVSEKGECAYVPVHKLPVGRWSVQGKHLSTFGLDIGNNEVVFACDYDGSNKAQSIFLLKDSGVGKQSLAFDYVKARGHFSLTSGIKCREDEKVLGGWLLDLNVENYIALMDNKYANMYFEASEMPITGVRSGGSLAIKLNKKQKRYVSEYKLYNNVEDIPEFCQARERGQAGWQRKASQPPVTFKTEETA